MKKILFTLVVIVLISTITSYLLENKAFAVSDTPHITEVMANPKGPDAGNEWIEIYNPSNFDANLEGWKIRNSNRETILKEFIIEKNSYKLLRSKDFKFPLKNSNEIISLLDKNDRLISEVEIKKAIETKSMSLIEIQSKNLKKKIWMEDNPSPGVANNKFYEIEGNITKNLEIDKKAKIYIEKRKILIPDNFDFNTLRSHLKKDDKVKALVKFQNNNFYLNKIMLMEKTKEKIEKEEKTSQVYYLLIPIFILGILIVFDEKIFKKVKV